MKTLFSRSLVSASISLLMLIAGTQSLSAAELSVLGSLQANGQIQVLNDKAPAPVKIADTTYAYMAGDTVKTGNGTGVLNISGLGRIGLAPDTEASVAKTDKGLNVDVASGALAYALTPGSSVTIQAAGITLQPTRSPVQPVSDTGPQQVTGWVKVGKDGKVEVGARSGRIEISHGGSMQVVEAGQQSMLALQGGKLIATQAGGAGAGAGFGGLTSAQLIGLVVVGVGAVAAGVTLATNDNNNPASP